MAKVQSWNQFLSHWQRKQTSYCGLPWCNIIPKVRVQEKKNKNKVYMVKSQTSNTFIAHSSQTSTKWDGPMGELRGWPSGPQPPLCLWNFVSFLIILSKIYSNYIAGKCLSCPFLNFLDPPPGPRLSPDDIIANTKENIHVIIMAFLSLMHCRLSYKCPSWVGVRRDSGICRLVPSLQNSSF